MQRTPSWSPLLDTEIMHFVKFEQPPSTWATERYRSGELRPWLHWKGLLFIAREPES